MIDTSGSIKARFASCRRRVRIYLAGGSPKFRLERSAALADPGFGRVFTDHMVTIEWSRDAGWHNASVKPRRPFLLDPAAAVLHYAQEIFEGLKAYRLPDGNAALFRPHENARRFAASAERLAMPQLPEALFVRSIEELIRVDSDWIPSGTGSLYLRPFQFSGEPFLGVRPASTYVYSVIASPAGSYFKDGNSAIKLWATERYSRAARGGTGAAKCGGNYAGGLAAQAEAARHDCDQVVVLDAAEHRYVEELGGMNIFFVFVDGSLRTPPLGDTILHGITRGSILELAKTLGRNVHEEPYSLAEWRADARSGKLAECFACGTAAVIIAVEEVKTAQDTIKIGKGGCGPVTEQLRAELVGIQRGTRPGPSGWMHTVSLTR